MKIKNKKFYEWFVPFASDYVKELYQIATTTPEKIHKRQPEKAYFRFISYESPSVEKLYHRIEEHRSPGISYRHIIESGEKMEIKKTYPLDKWIIRRLFFDVIFN